MAPTQSNVNLLRAYNRSRALGINVVELDGGPDVSPRIIQFPDGTLTVIDAQTVRYTPKSVGNSDLPSSLVGMAGRPLQVKTDETGYETPVPYDLVSLTTNIIAVAEDAGNNRVTLTGLRIPVGYQWQTPATTSVGMFAALTEWPNSQRRQKIDLTYATQVRLIARCVAAFPAGSKVALIYTKDDWVNKSYMDGTGASGGAGPVCAMTAANTTVDSGWVTLHANAKADIEIAMGTVGGDGTTTGTIGIVTAQFR